MGWTGRYILTLTIVFAEHQDSRCKDAYETQSQPSAPPRGNLCAPQQYNPVQECGVREVPSKAQQSSCQLHGYGTCGRPLHCSCHYTACRSSTQAMYWSSNAVSMRSVRRGSLASRPWHKRKPARAVVQALERVLVPARGLSADHRASEGHEGGRAARASSSYSGLAASPLCGLCRVPAVPSFRQPRRPGQLPAPHMAVKPGCSED